VLVLLFLLVLAALAGVLGLVLKITLVVVLTLILSVVLLATLAWLWIRHQWKKIQQEAQLQGTARSTTIQVGDPVRGSTEPLPEPGRRDDRY
jgi:hypothetical protein